MCQWKDCGGVKVINGARGNFARFKATHLFKVNSRSIFEISSSFTFEWYFQNLILTASKNSDGLRRILGHKLVAVLCTTKADYPTVDEESYEKCRSAITLLKSGIRHIRDGRENLQKLYNEIRYEYKNCKNKSEKKDLMLEIEQIEDESQLQIAIAEANDFIFMLTSRNTACCTRGEKQNSDEVETQNTQNDDGEQNSNHNESEPSTSKSGFLNSVDSVQNHTEQFRYRSIKPPQASLPKFHGDAEDFAEYWAIFETIVHKSKELDVIEKILLLKESLRGRAQIAIKGIKLIPENYDWIIKNIAGNILQ